MPTITCTNSQAGIDTFIHRKLQDEFYSQDFGENLARLIAKFPGENKLVTELAFIHKEMLLRGRS